MKVTVVARLDEMHLIADSEAFVDGAFYAAFMDAPSPAVLASKPQNASLRPAGEEHARTGSIRGFGWFRYKGEEFIPQHELGRRAWSDALDALAQLSEPEDWTGSSPSGRHLPILDSYVRYTFQRLDMEGKIATSEGGGFAAFNTGLLTAHAEEIYCLFQKNTRQDAPTPWIFQRWATESDWDILRNFPIPPEVASYVTAMSDLVYDHKRDLKLSYEHILGDNLERFPADLAAQPMRARQALDQAVALTLKRARRNYKIVVPQWYPKLQGTGAQFLMPLDLTGSGEADLALVVSSVGETLYRGNTVLTLAMAYTNARLVCRPDSEWLRPIAVPTDLDDSAHGPALQLGEAAD